MKEKELQELEAIIEEQSVLLSQGNAILDKIQVIYQYNFENFTRKDLSDLKYFLKEFFTIFFFSICIFLWYSSWHFRGDIWDFGVNTIELIPSALLKFTIGLIGLLLVYMYYVMMLPATLLALFSAKMLDDALKNKDSIVLQIALISGGLILFFKWAIPYIALAIPGYFGYIFYSYLHQYKKLNPIIENFRENRDFINESIAHNRQKISEDLILRFSEKVIRVSTHNLIDSGFDFLSEKEMAAILENQVKLGNFKRVQLNRGLVLYEYTKTPKMNNITTTHLQID